MLVSNVVVAVKIRDVLDVRVQEDNNLHLLYYILVEKEFTML